MTGISIEENFEIAKERYGQLGIDAEAALKALDGVSVSLPCWQGDDVGGFEETGGELVGGGIMATGSYPGKARTIGELRSDLVVAYSLIPGNHRLNLHASYGDFGGGKTDRNRIETNHFLSWMEWAREQRLGLDFNATLFSHPMAESNYTLSSFDQSVRKFWIEHVKRCREIGAWIGSQLGESCLHNLWIPDGSKDSTVNRRAHRERLRDSLEAIFHMQYPRSLLKDSVEGKLFGIGSESYVVGSYDFYLAWTASNDIMLCLDMGHFHPTESVADKLSALLPFYDELVLHLSRGVRWDSDHVVVQDDDLSSLAHEIVRADALDRLHLALDFFDASINRVGAWVVGARSTLKALLVALLEPTDLLREKEAKGDYFARLAMLEEVKSLPWGAVWEYHCFRKNVPGDRQWLDVVRNHEKEELSQRR
ncbi:MAG: L-rhamnose isomerase [Proteobacteria bacterium]|nr:L-rhamnose isomerase [Pseudomonadota bacterium]